MPEGKEVVLVEAEVDALANAIDGARLLMECLRNSQLGSAVDEGVAEKAVLALLSFSVTRLRGLARALRGTLDASHLLGSHNSVPLSTALAGDHAVILRVHQTAPVKVRTTKSPRGHR